MVRKQLNTLRLEHSNASGRILQYFLYKIRNIHENSTKGPDFFKFCVNLLETTHIYASCENLYSINRNNAGFRTEEENE